MANCPAFALPANEKDIISRLHSFQSTWFYKIHGLVQFWRDRWLSQHPAKSVVKDVHDFGTLPKQHHLEKVLIKEFKEHAKEFKEHQKEFFKEHAKEFKEKDKDKDLVENPGGFNHGDPAVFAALQARVAELEKTVQQGQTFIKAEERPAVGQPVVKPTKRK